MSEIGGDFHWPGLPLGDCLPWPEPHTLFSTGREIVTRIAQMLSADRIWLPDYFCPHTAQYWHNAGLELVRYTDHPRRSQPDWDTLNPNRDDIVIAVNYFGVRTAQPWQSWKNAYSSITLIEDHTHDPLSAWACNSNADYAFASLRKTFPTPDGAIVWSPLGHPIPGEPTGQQWSGSALKLAAMVWKREYIIGGETDQRLKRIFREFQLEGEERLDNNADQQLPPWSRELLGNGIPIAWRQQRENNVRQLLERLPRSDLVVPLFETWPVDHCPFNVVLVVHSVEQRDALRRHFIEAGIYPPIHWVLPATAQTESQDISQRILTIPVDHRYDIADLDRIVRILQKYKDKP